MHSENGDSGGIVYTYYDSEYIPVGIVMGGNSYSGESYIVKAPEILESMNVYAY